MISNNCLFQTRRANQGKQQFIQISITIALLTIIFIFVLTASSLKLKHFIISFQSFILDLATLFYETVLYLISLIPLILQIL